MDSSSLSYMRRTTHCVSAVEESLGTFQGENCVFLNGHFGETVQGRGVCLPSRWSEHGFV
jgi:hypothetical protein